MPGPHDTRHDHETEVTTPGFVVEPRPQEMRTTVGQPPSERLEAKRLSSREGVPSLGQIGQYAITAELGRGGMGVVYKAYDAVLKRNVALKMILDPTRAGGELVERFAREASAVARLHDPRIIAVYEVGEHEGNPYLVMEYVEGQSFERHLRDERVPARKIAELVREIALALQHAHENGIVHRDVKPENVLVDRAGHAHLMDFGLARDLSATTRLTVPGQVLGTPAYMAPEQAGGGARGVTSKADIYSLGAVLYRALTGEPPFEGPELQEVMYKVITQDPLPPRKIDPRIHPDLETIALRCLAKEPERRYESAGAVAEELRRFLEGEPIEARPVGSFERIWLRVRRNRRAAVAVLVALLAVLAFVSFLHVRHSRELERAEAARLEQERLAREEAEKLARAKEEARLAQARLACEEAEKSGKKNEHDAAIASASKAIELAPELAEGWFQRGEARFHKGELDAALADAERVIQLEPAGPRGFSLRAGIRQNSGHSDLALADASHAIELDSRLSSAWSIRAGARYNLGQIDAAIDDATQAIALDPKFAEAYSIRAACYEHRGSYDEAIRDANEALRLGPNFVHALYSRAAARMKKGKNYQAALADAVEATRLAPKNVDVWNLRAVIHATLNDDAGVVEDATKILEINPRYAQAWNMRGHSRAALGDKEGAIADLTHFLELEPKGRAAAEAREKLEELRSK